MKPLKLFGMVIFCGLLSPTQGVLSGLSCTVSTNAIKQVLSSAIISSGLLQTHLHDLVLPNIMSDRGLLSSLIVITGLHLEKSQLPTLSLELLPGIGMQLAISVHLDFSGNCLIGLLSNVIVISLDVTITTNIKYANFESGAVQVIADDCFCILGAVKIELLSGLVSLSVHDVVLSHLTATLPGLVRAVFPDHHQWFPHAAVIPIGSKGMLRYGLVSPPFISGSSLIMNLDGTVQQIGGSIIPHNSYASAMPSLPNRLMTICMRQSFLNSVLILQLQIQPYTFPCSPETFSEANQLIDSIIALYPAGCTSCPMSSLLSIHVEGAGNPILHLEPNKATVELPVLLQILGKRPDESIINLLLLKVNLNLNIHLSISRGSLVLAFSLNRYTSKCLILDTSDKGAKENAIVSASQGMIKDWEASLTA
uniref:Lipid-binding serum glycoprotein N-terminal domain-containing protein n=1 Tax=Phasianus colchicus TaxID=9054 RepID=A0A669PFI2_PHACC